MTTSSIACKVFKGEVDLDSAFGSGTNMKSEYSAQSEISEESEREFTPSILRTTFLQILVLQADRILRYLDIRYDHSKLGSRGLTLTSFSPDVLLEEIPRVHETIWRLRSKRSRIFDPIMRCRRRYHAPS